MKKTIVKMSWTCKREAMYMLVYKHVENDHTGVGWRITSLISFRHRIIFNSSLSEYFSIQQITLIYI